VTGAALAEQGQKIWKETFPRLQAGGSARIRAMEDAVRIAFMMTVLFASGCVVRAGPPPHRHWFWHGRHAEITNPVSSEGEALTLPPRDASEQ